MFCVALPNYDIPLHQPHPPGFPLYVGLGRLREYAGLGDFHALQAINVLAAMFLFPLVYLLARAFGYELRMAICGAALFVFLPNVWFLGGTAFSDIPSLALLLGAVVLLLRGRKDRRAYFLGSLMLALPLSFRPQNPLIAPYPWLAPSLSRDRERAGPPPPSAALR